MRELEALCHVRGRPPSRVAPNWLLGLVSARAPRMTKSALTPADPGRLEGSQATLAATTLPPVPAPKTRSKRRNTQRKPAKPASESASAAIARKPAAIAATTSLATLEVGVGTLLLGAGIGAVLTLFLMRNGGKHAALRAALKMGSYAV